MEPFTHILEPDLEQLLLDKSFAELSLEEKALVLTELSEREYTRLREFTLTTKAYFRQDKPVQPRPHTRQVLLNRLAARKESGLKGLVLRLARYPVPAWQVAASMGLLVMALYFGPSRSITQPGNDVPHNIIVDSTHVDSSYRQPFTPNEDTMVHLTSERL